LWSWIRFCSAPREAVRRFELDPHNAGKTGFEIARFHGSQYRAGLYAERPHRGGSLAARLQSHPWTRSLGVSISAHEKRWDFKLRRIDCKVVLVLQRPIETTPLIGMCLLGAWNGQLP
jgi:hypothetical protein